ncbi:iron uptake porin [Moorena sp. SIO4A1]|uniref:iron uptake porin n=3 Tax=unclassified Moorena TaxID=2683338 RepID=UPI0025D369B3|nr:iron uptake porin [Moorena sp. SIO4A1]
MRRFVKKFCGALPLTPIVLGVHLVTITPAMAESKLETLTADWSDVNPNPKYLAREYLKTPPKTPQLTDQFHHELEFKTTTSIPHSGISTASLTSLESPPDLEVADTVSNPFMGQVAPISKLLDIPSTQTNSNSLDNSLDNSPDNSLDISQNLGVTDPLSNGPMERVTPVYELSDVQPTDWAYEALQSLLKRYRCLTGYEDDTYRGNRALTRYEFAFGLNFCLNRVNAMIIGKTANLVTEADLAAMQRLQEEFSDELATVQARVDNLEGRVTFLEDHQFSTTTILRGSVDIALATGFGGKKAVPSGQSPTEDFDDTNTLLGGRAILNFDTSFTGRDLLRTRLRAGNTSNFSTGFTGTAMTKFGFATNTGNDVKLNQLFYRFPLGNKGLVSITAAGQGASALIPTLNPVFTISSFGFNNYIYDLGFGAGAAIYYQFNDVIATGAAYYTGSASNSDFGLFNGAFGALAQVTLTPSDRFGMALTYVRYYSPETANTASFLGSEFAQSPFGSNTATSSNSLGVSTSYRFSDRFTLGGWVGYSNAIAESSPRNNDFDGSTGSKADIWSWAITAAFPDIGKLGSQLNLIVGMPPRLASNDVAGRRDRDVSYHLELSYRYPLTDRIFITPGVLVIIDPEHNDENDTIGVGLLRTQFNF